MLHKLKSVSTRIFIAIGPPVLDLKGNSQHAPEQVRRLCTCTMGGYIKADTAV